MYEDPSGNEVFGNNNVLRALAKMKEEAMRLRSKFINSFLQADEYEAIGLCFQELYYYEPNAGKGFVAQHIDIIKKGASHIELAEKFEQLRGNLLKTVQAVAENFGGGFDTFNDKLLNLVQVFSHPKDFDRKIAIAIAAFYLIEALDSYVYNNLQYMSEFGEWPENGRGPMNQGVSKKKCLVYLKERRSFLSGAYKNNRTGFRTPLNAEDLGDIFSTIQIVSRNRLISNTGIPRIIPVRPNDDIKKNIAETGKFRIATIPFIGYDSFYFHEIGASTPCPPQTLPQGRFYVEYSQEFEEENIRLMTHLLELAIRQGSNIIVLPEFIMSPSMRESVVKYLSQMTDSWNSQLVLIFAGTTYEYSTPNKGNNVLYVMNARGSEIGKYYKFSPFHKDNKHDAPIEISGDNSSVYFENIELLSDPGKECTIFDVEGIGRILPAICRDVVDGEYTSELVKLFSPHLLLIPAWSSSVASFDTYLAHYANTIHTTSLLCNCCNAVKSIEASESGTAIGRFCLPEKSETVMKAFPQSIYRSTECCNSCRDHGGCVVLIDVDFSKGMPQYHIMKAIHPKDT